MSRSWEEYKQDTPNRCVGCEETYEAGREAERTAHERAVYQKGLSDANVILANAEIELLNRQIEGERAKSIAALDDCVKAHLRAEQAWRAETARLRAALETFFATNDRPQTDDCTGAAIEPFCTTCFFDVPKCACAVAPLRAALAESEG